MFLFPEVRLVLKCEVGAVCVLNPAARAYNSNANGVVDAGETVESSVIRELKEETGLTVTQMNKVSPPIYSSSGMTDESVAMAYVECSGDVSQEGNCSSEDIETLFVSPDEARALCGNSQIKFDVKTWLVLSPYGETGSLNW